MRWVRMSERSRLTHKISGTRDLSDPSAFSNCNVLVTEPQIQSVRSCDHGVHDTKGISAYSILTVVASVSATASWAQSIQDPIVK